MYVHTYVYAHRTSRDRSKYSHAILQDFFLMRTTFAHESCANTQSIAQKAKTICVAYRISQSGSTLGSPRLKREWISLYWTGYVTSMSMMYLSGITLHIPLSFRMRTLSARGPVRHWWLTCGGRTTELHRVVITDIAQLEI